MYEIIDKIGGEEPPQLVIVDECVRDKRFVNEMVKRGKRNGNSDIAEGIITIHIGYDGFEPGMSDSEIVELGRTLGYPYILTHDRHFRRFKESYDKTAGGYGRIIKLRQMDSIQNYLKAVKRAGIKISGDGIRKVRSFG
ncbi:MAG: hypothetical protein WA139_05410 [Candidatus Aenigmatarchaeota archaeon]